MATLNETLDAALKFGGSEFYKSRVPNLIYSNLRNNYGQRPYQQDAFGRFVFYTNEYFDKPKGAPTQLLFHMATGSGKTVIMAGLILYLYEKGYRNFLFFVNSANIIEKTKDNFLNIASSKYLFADNVKIGDRQIRIKEVDNFQAVNEDDINIVFSTIQGLHTKLNTPKENSLTYDDFEDKKIVLISDEAHHINASTKKKGEKNNDDQDLEITWEQTVNRIFKANNSNMLLEFTATVDLSIPEIESKYSDKLIYDYPLKQFRKDGYSKEVKVLEADLPSFERALQGVLLSQYRRKIFEKHKKLIKPVILFKSKTIRESQEFYDEFSTKIQKLKIADLEKISKTNPDKVIQNVFNFLKENNITLENLIAELKEDFSSEKLISVNSKDESEQKQLAVNSLEDEKNEYRAVFAVDKLNEGWDVLNLFDIVRLYNTRDAKDGKPGKTTMAEAQLIGRGARYCPFKLDPEQPLYERKFDDDVHNELRICEELYYHSYYNPRYIQELNTALEEIGIKAKRSIERQIYLKPEFKATPFFNNAFVFLNEQQEYDRTEIFSLDKSLIEQSYKINLKTGYTKSSFAFGNSVNEGVSLHEKQYNLSQFGETVIRKALSKLDFYQFSNLKKHLPNLNSISEFISSDNYLGKIKIDVVGLESQISALSQKEKLEAAIKVLDKISNSIGLNRTEFRGSKEFTPTLLKDKIKDKTLNITLSESEDKEFGKSMVNPIETNYYLDLSTKDWYVFNDCFGTSEEKLLVKYIDKVYDKLKSDYDKIYLIRNERYFKLYNFEDGRALEPDFVLFLQKDNKDDVVHYQIFIEPKGEHLMKMDEWKEAFLIKLKTEHKIEQLWKDRKYIVWGLPFYNERLKQTEFNKAFSEIANI